MDNEVKLGLLFVAILILVFTLYIIISYKKKKLSGDKAFCEWIKMVMQTIFGG